MNIRNEVLIRAYILLFFIVLAACLIFFKAVKISTVEGDKWRGLGADLYVKYMPVNAERGNIIAEDGSLLATSLPFFEIRFDPNSTGMEDEAFMANVDSLAYCLATYVDNTYTVGGYRDFLIEQREGGARNILIKKDVSYTELEQIKKFPLFRLGQYAGGFIVNRDPQRNRPYGMLAQRTIGYVREGAKPVGIEGYFDEVLGGQEGQKLMQRVGNNTWIPVNDLMEIEPQNGDDIVTTIDINLQEATEEALYRAVNHHNADHGTAVLMEVKTGAIKAIANIGRLSTDKLWETYNYAIGEAVEPGSTYKLAAIMALLEDGHIKLDDSIDLEQGKHQFYEEEMLDASFHQFDTTTIRTAFEISSNVGMAKLVDKYYAGKAQKFIDELKEMNLHLPVGIEIEGEAAPYIKTAYKEEDDWSGITLPWMSIGYEVLITPLQLLNFFNSVANDGKMMKPYLVSEIQHFGETVQQFKPTVVKRHIASKNTISKAQELLEGVVLRGTAEKFKSSRYTFAGKTGTAQIDYRKFVPNANVTHRSSFVGYFPADNPVYSCIVMITDPKAHGFYGSEVALPVFREIADHCYDSKIQLHQAYNQRPRPELLDRQLPAYDAGDRQDVQHILDFMDIPYAVNVNSNWVVTSPQPTDTLQLNARNMEGDIVPNVVGMGLRDALYMLENKGLKVVFSGSGKVVQQSIIPGTRAQAQNIRIRLN